MRNEEERRIEDELLPTAWSEAHPFLSKLWRERERLNVRIKRVEDGMADLASKIHCRFDTLENRHKETHDKQEAISTCLGETRTSITELHERFVAVQDSYSVVATAFNTSQLQQHELWLEYDAKQRKFQEAEEARQKDMLEHIKKLVKIESREDKGRWGARLLTLALLFILVILAAVRLYKTGG